MSHNEGTELQLDTKERQRIEKNERVQNARNGKLGIKL